MRKVTFFDVEYANKTNKSLCQMGLICENAANGDPIYPDRDIFVNPEDMFEKACTSLHGIDAKRVKNAKTFPKVWEGVEKYFTSSVIVGYNTADDLDALCYALNRYKLGVPALYYVDTRELAQLYIPAGETSDFTLSGLCSYFGIKMLTEHYAYDDALGNADLFKKLVPTFNIDVEKHIHKYEPAQDILMVSISHFYGMVHSFSMNERIGKQEADYINRWAKDHQQYADHKQVAAVLKLIDSIKQDDTITLQEMKQLEKALKDSLMFISTSHMTVSTHILEGMLRGIAADGQADLDECRKLQQWLNENAILTGNFIYDKLTILISDALSDGMISDDESRKIIDFIRNIL